MTCKHEWKYKTRCFGTLPKQNTPDIVGTNGHTAYCVLCKKVMFFPDDTRLQPVEIESEAK
jgi:hypothetical protein